MRAGIHLAFDGDCKQAFEFYRDTLGAEIQLMLRYGDSPAGAAVPKDMHNKIVHATLRLGDVELAGSDNVDYHAPAGFQLLLQLSDTDQARGLFEVLAEGGRVALEMQETFWSPCYGTVIDRWGVPWEINVSA